EDYFQSGFRKGPILLIFYMKCLVVVHKEKMIVGSDVHITSLINPINPLLLKLLLYIWENLSVNQQKWVIGLGQLIDPGKLMGPNLLLMSAKPANVSSGRWSFTFASTCCPSWIYISHSPISNLNGVRFSRCSCVMGSILVFIRSLFS